MNNHPLLPWIDSKGGNIFKDDEKWVAELDGWGTDDDYIRELCSLDNSTPIHKVFLTDAKISSSSLALLVK